jgi:hypothetical protein
MAERAASRMTERAASAACASVLVSHLKAR